MSGQERIHIKNRQIKQKKNTRLIYKPATIKNSCERKNAVSFIESVMYLKQYIVTLTPKEKDCF